MYICDGYYGYYRFYVTLHIIWVCVHVHTDAAVAMVTAIPVQLDWRGIAIATEDELYTRQDQLRAAVILSGMSHSL